VFPYRDENLTLRTPVVTLALIALNALAWFLVQGAGMGEALPASVCNYGLIPGELTLLARPGTGAPLGPGLMCLVDPGRAPQNILFSMFLHGSWGHILGNMWFLWLFGNNVEDSMGRARFVAFYLLCGLAAALAQVLANPGSVVPMVGASGAISGVMVRTFCSSPTRVCIRWCRSGSSSPPSHCRPGSCWATGCCCSCWAVSAEPRAGWPSAHTWAARAGVALIKLFVRRDYLAQHKAHHWRPKRLGLERSRWR